MYGWETDNVIPDSFKTENHEENNQDGGLPAYWRTGFLSFQKRMSDTFKSMRLAADNGASMLPKKEIHIRMQRFAFPPFVSHPMYMMAEATLLLVTSLSFMVTNLYVTRTIATDYEKGIKEYLNMVGLSKVAYYVAYFVINMLKALIPILVVGTTYHVMYPESNFLIQIVFVSLFAMNSIALGFFISASTRKGTIATMMSLFVWVLLLFPALYFIFKPEKQSKFQKVYSCFMINPLISFAVALFENGRVTGLGVTWSNLAEAHGDKLFSMAFIWFMFFCDFLLILLLLAILETDWQRLIDLLLTRSSTHHYEHSKLTFKDSAQGRNNNINNVENEGRPNRVEVKGARIIYKSNRFFGKTSVAVENASFIANDRNVTALLGRNGSGKTSLLQLLAGLKSATSGSVDIGGLDGLHGRSKLTDLIGYCPQYNPLFDCLTVYEHLSFYSRLKGCDGTSIHWSCSIMKLLKLWPKRFDYSKLLSGGMKRKLSLMIALAGNSKVILLDEPTSGMDVEVRKDVEALLLAEKRDRLIIFTTHYMDEANAVADQIVLMHEGVVLDKGSPRSLKNRSGEYISMELTMDECSNQDDLLIEIKRLIHMHAPKAELGTRNGRMLKIRFPILRCPWNSMEKIVEELDANRQYLRIVRLNLAMTPLEEAILQRVERETKGRIDDRKLDGIEKDLLSEKSYQFKVTDKKAVKTGLSLLCRQIISSIRVKVLSVVREPQFVIPQLLVPLFSVGISIYIRSQIDFILKETPSLNLSDMDPYKGGNMLLTDNPGGDLDLTNRLRNACSQYGLTVETVAVDNDTTPADAMDKVILQHAETEGIHPFYSNNYFGFSQSSEQRGNKTVVDIHFNNQAPHVISSALNILSSVLLNQTLGSGYKFA